MLRSQIRAAAARPWGLQYTSGLYADHDWRAAWSALVPGAASTLVLLGNCGSAATPEKAANTAEFLRRCSSAWERVLWVPGPHEYSSAGCRPPKVYPILRDALGDLAQDAAGANGNIQILDQGEVHIPEVNVLLLGATGWTDAAALDRLPSKSLEAQSIWTFHEGRQRPFDLATVRGFHDDDMDWIHGTMDAWRARSPSTKQILLTHSLCSGKLVSRDWWRRGRGCGVERLGLDMMSHLTTERCFQNPSLHAWLCGASGSSVSGRVGPRTVFGSVNACWTSPGGWRNPAYLPDRRLEMAGGGRTAGN